MAKKCSDCDLGDRCTTNRMQGVGPLKAKIMIIADAPTWGDDKAGEPFIGDSGAKLDYYLDKLGVDRDDVHVTYAVKCAPAKINDLKPKHIAACKKYTIKEILDVRPKVIITMGKAGLQQLLNQNTVHEFRGHFEEIKIPFKFKGEDRNFKVQVIPTHSPLSAMTKWEYDDYIIHDIKKAVKYSKTGELPEIPKIKHTLVLDLKTLKEFEAHHAKSKYISMDLETTGLKFYKEEIIVAGYADNDNHAWIVPMCEYKKEHLESKKWNAEDVKLALKVNKFVSKYKKKIFKAVKRVNANQAEKGGHHFKFDAKFLRWWGVPAKNYTYDSVVGDALVDENKYHDLNTVMEYHGINFGPYDTKLWPYVNKDAKKKKSYLFAPPGTLHSYLAIDSCGANRLKAKNLKKLEKEGMLDLFYKRQMPLTRLMADVEYRGVKFDVEKLGRISKIFKSRIAELESLIRKKTKLKDLNINSPDQLRNWFQDNDYPFEKYEVKKGKTGYSCGEDTLKKFQRSKKYREVPTLILEYRKLVKLKNTFLDGKDGEGGFLNHIDKKNFAHANWNIHTPRTGRMSSSEPNFQNIPRPDPNYPDANIRQLFITRKKKNVIWSADFAQLEMRVGAHLSRDKVMIREIQEGVDLHTRNVVMFGTRLGFLPKGMTEDKFSAIRKFKEEKDYEEKYRKQPEKLKEIRNSVLERGIFDEHRSFAKTLGFGLNYGMDANTLAQNHDMDKEEVQDMIDLYFEKYHRLNKWREKIIKTAMEDGVLVLPETGRKRRFHQASQWFASDFSQNIRKREFDMSAIDRQAMNFPIQGFANEIFVEGKLKLEAQLRKRKLKSRILLSLHDGIIGEGPRKEMPIVKQLVKECMERILGEGKFAVPLKVDFELFSCWYGEKLDIESLQKKAA